MVRNLRLVNIVHYDNDVHIGRQRRDEALKTKPEKANILMIRYDNRKSQK